MRCWKFIASAAEIAQLAEAVNALHELPKLDDISRLKPAARAIIEASQAMLSTWDVTQPPPLGVRAFWVGSFVEQRLDPSDAESDATGSMILKVHDSLDGLLFGPEGTERLTGPQKALLHRETPGRGDWTLDMDPADWGPEE